MAGEITITATATRSLSRVSRGADTGQRRPMRAKKKTTTEATPPYRWLPRAAGSAGSAKSLLPRALEPKLLAGAALPHPHLQLPTKRRVTKVVARRAALRNPAAPRAEVTMKRRASVGSLRRHGPRPRQLPRRPQQRRRALLLLRGPSADVAARQSGCGRPALMASQEASLRVSRCARGVRRDRGHGGGGVTAILVPPLLDRRRGRPQAPRARVAARGRRRDWQVGGRALLARRGLRKRPRAHLPQGPAPPVAPAGPLEGGADPLPAGRGDGGARSGHR